MKKLVLVACGAAFFGAGAVALAADDPFLWLEDRYGEKSIAWVTEQNKKTAAEFTADPRFSEYFDAALKLFTAEDNIAYGSADRGVVYNFWSDGRNPLGIWRRTSIESYKTDTPDWETLIDFDMLAREEGTNWVFFGSSCTDDGVRCLIYLSPDGGDAVEIREWDVATKSFVKDGFFSPVSMSGMGWAGNDAVIITAAYEADEQTVSGYPRVVKVLERGQALKDAKVIFEAERGDLSASGYQTEDNGVTYRFVTREIDFYNYQQHLVLADGSLRAIPVPTDLSMAWVYKGQMIFSPRSEWTAPDGTVTRPNGLYSFDFASWAAGAGGDIGRVTVMHEPAERVAISSIGTTKDRIFLVLLDNVRGRVVAYDRTADGWIATSVALPDKGDVYINHTDYYGSSVSFGFQDFLTPPSIIWSDDDGRTLSTIKTLAPRFDASPYMIEQFEAVSKDGTKVPYFVVRSRAQAGPVPTLLYGYGGFENSMTPWYSSVRGKFWLEQGNAWALANIRGGGEFGAEWHQAALKENRQRSYDDMAAIAEDLARRGITTAKQLGVQGGSNGGLLTGVMLTQRPDLFGAVISDVPLLDMLRYTALPPGASWIAEYGDPAIPEEAAYIARYSPYQNVVSNAKYPQVLFTTSTADDRVHPGHARKMAALMQSHGHTAWFQENTEGGHGGNGDPSPQAFVYALQYIFLQRVLEGEGNHPEPTVSRAMDEPAFEEASASPEATRDRFRSRTVVSEQGRSIHQTLRRPPQLRRIQNLLQ
jgi:prolyl oligopeptidase